MSKNMGNAGRRLNRTSPSLHLLAITVILALAAAGYLAVIWSGRLKGYSPSVLVAIRDLSLFVPIIGVFFWLMRRQRFRGELLPLTAAIFLFAMGLLAQYRLFTDPEYGERGAERARAREAKTQTIRLRNVQTGYDDEKKAFLFGGADRVPESAQAEGTTQRSYSVFDLIQSPNSYIPLMALAAMVGGFLLFKSEKWLLWFQRHSLIIGLVTLLPFAIIVLVFSQEGKFLGQTTPWEVVKILFLLGYAGMLADSYQHLRRTRWGLPPARNLIPFLAIAAMPVVPFFALSDFGQMLVFFGVYVMLYVIAVRKKAQLVYAVAVVAVLFGMFFIATKATTGFGLPARVHFRFYQWVHTWEPPAPDTWWWKRDYERYLKATGASPDAMDQAAITQRNREAWADKVLQQSQGLFGINEGGVAGEGLGLGFPETVPVSDSDFIYAAVGEESGLLGALGLLTATVVFVFAGTAVSLGARDMFTKLLAAGLTAIVGFQAIVNIGGVLRLLPMTGITLPFVSHGGWSLITSFGMLGILLAFSHRNRAAIEAQKEQPAVVSSR